MDHRFWAEWDRSWLKLADTAVKIKNTAFMYDFTGIHAMYLQPVLPIIQNLQVVRDLGVFITATHDIQQINNMTFGYFM